MGYFGIRINKFYLCVVNPSEYNIIIINKIVSTDLVSTELLVLQYKKKTDIILIHQQSIESGL